MIQWDWTIFAVNVLCAIIGWLIGSIEKQNVRHEYFNAGYDLGDNATKKRHDCNRDAR